MPKQPMIALFVLALLTVPALADKIDGDWCNAEGQHFRIDGSRIETPAGIATTGDYRRHFFHYVAPAGDPDEGQAIDMTLQSEELLFLQRTRSGETGPTEKWRRCQMTS
jgi:hypothetical protein